MSTKSVKSKIKKGADKSESRIASAAASLSNGAATSVERSGAVAEARCRAGNTAFALVSALLDF